MHILLFTLSLFFASVGGQIDYDVQYDESVVEIYWGSSWYNLRDNIDYKEGGPLCNALSSNYSLLDHNKIDVGNQEVCRVLIISCGITIKNPTKSKPKALTFPSNFTMNSFSTTFSKPSP